MADKKAPMEFREAALEYDAEYRASLRVVPSRADADAVVSAADFKARCLALMDEVAETGTELIVTKRGKPIVKLVAYVAPKPVDLRGSLLFEAEDAWEPDAEAWAESAWAFPDPASPNQRP